MILLEEKWLMPRLLELNVLKDKDGRKLKIKHTITSGDKRMSHTH